MASRSVDHDTKDHSSRSMFVNSHSCVAKSPGSLANFHSQPPSRCHTRRHLVEADIVGKTLSANQKLFFGSLIASMTKLIVGWMDGSCLPRSFALLHFAFAFRCPVCYGFKLFAFAFAFFGFMLSRGFLVIPQAFFQPRYDTTLCFCECPWRVAVDLESSLPLGLVALQHFQSFCRSDAASQINHMIVVQHSS